MDIFMRNVAFNVDQRTLKLHLAPIFHAPEYSGGSATPINFEVRIFKHNKGRTKNGVITVPTIQIGQRFLQDYGKPSPQKRLHVGTTIYFEQSTKPPLADALETVRRLPYVDPRILQEREARTSEVQGMAIAVAMMQFGRVCRDEVFSVEWEKWAPYKAELTFDEDRREFRLQWDESTLIRFIAIRTSSIYWTSAGRDTSGDHTIFLYLNHAPSYETQAHEAELATLFSQLLSPRASTQSPKRQRWSAFDNDHESVAPYTSLAIRIVCPSSADVEMYRKLAKIAHTSVDSSTYPVERRGVCARNTYTQYYGWVADLPWPLAFQVEALLRSHLTDMHELLVVLRRPIEDTLQRNGAASAAAIVREFHSRVKAIFWTGDAADNGGGEESIGKLFALSRKEFLSKPAMLGNPILEDADLFECFHVTVTPTTMFLEGPFPERSNRVMRRYKSNQDSFMRVSFQDETQLSYRFDRDIDGHDLINRRVRDFLVKGLTVAGRHFDFLAYSQSALKEHAVWFVKPFEDAETNSTISAARILDGLGSFRNLSYDPNLIRCPARYAARISQAFTATDSSLAAEAEEMIAIPDLKTEDMKYCFTDGVGTISAEFAQAIWRELRAKGRRAGRARTYPRLYQIRLGGSKGMLSVDYKLQGRAIGLRPSMVKFDAPNSFSIEIARAFDRPGKYYLNRPLIMLLEGLGVPYDVFQSLQDDAVRDAQESTESLERSARLLEAYGLGASYRITSTMLSLHRLCVGPLTKDIFWQQMMDFAVNHVLRELKHRAHIPVPNGWTLVGAADHYGYLREGEIFACVDAPDVAGLIYLEGPVLVSRSPTIHPGDVQVVHAIGRPPRGSPFEKESLRNGVIFSIHGRRPLPSCLGGGDLDGDVYNLTPMPELRPRRLHKPASYEPAERKLVDHDSTMEDVADFIAEYISSDTLGIIATNWLIIADQSSQGIMDPDCLILSQLHSDAVDYPKSGNPVPVERIPKLKFRAKPDWNAPETHTSESKNWYESQRAIGRLFRSIELPALRTVARAARFQRRHMDDSPEYSPEDIVAEFRASGANGDDFVLRTVEFRIMELIPLSEDSISEDVIVTMGQLLDSYTSQLRGICAAHALSYARSAILTEEEALIGTIVAKTSQPRKRKDMMSRLREQTSSLVKAVRAEISGPDGTPSETSLERAWVAYKVALIQGDYFGARSFAWVALGEIFDAIRDIEEEDKKLMR
ncbi:RdRP-domain-containing protein [Daedalea quercina L-15889]|uniref:RNA-dependent RNA polymerase n=1 Tax=Daedalea quercina L-15889 TaxID=1314783 RepID=A0A165UCD7_9APHY|nr:RdRP-domain-containing protein [Daedalea quercina L-15889]